MKVGDIVRPRDTEYWQCLREDPERFAHLLRRRYFIVRKIRDGYVYFTDDDKSNCHGWDLEVVNKEDFNPSIEDAICVAIEMLKG